MQPDGNTYDDPARRWLDSTEEDLKIMGIRNWR
jgi:hypothetical protein